MYVDRTYRKSLKHKDLESFRVSVKETDLYISIDCQSYKPEIAAFVEKLVLQLRFDLETYIQADQEFKTTLNPHVVLPNAPPIVRTMAFAANLAGVGPMAAVAGTFAEYIGLELLKMSTEVIIENGGDIFIATEKKRLVSVFAGKSQFSNRLAVEVSPGQTPIGICTSSGTVGPSLSFGKADAAVIFAASAALADAAASAVGNVVQTAQDVKKGIEVAQALPDILGALVIKDNQMAAWGDFIIVPLASGK